jgi:hypothetical protein
MLIDLLVRLGFASNQKQNHIRNQPLRIQKESSDPDLNEGPVDLQSTALTSELPELM